MIVGAGLAGLIAAHAFPRERIVEAEPRPRQLHKALLRFRSAAVGEFVGVEFKPVTVRKGIWHDNWRQPNIRDCNLYSAKVIGRVVDRSIWNLDAVTRWIAPDDFYEQLVTALESRIEWGVLADFSARENIISTAPLHVTLDAVGLPHDLKFERAPITVTRFRVPGADVYQTVYYPSPHHSLYRASVTGDLLICEHAGEPCDVARGEVLRSFGLTEIEPLGRVEQKYGKIAPVHNAQRRALIAALTNDHGIYSLGRFATWRNILLDDVLHDAAVIKRLMNSSEYERRLKQ